MFDCMVLDGRPQPLHSGDSESTLFGYNGDVPHVGWSSGRNVTHGGFLAAMLVDGALQTTATQHAVPKEAHFSFHAAVAPGAHRVLVETTTLSSGLLHAKTTLRADTLTTSVVGAITMGPPAASEPPRRQKVGPAGPAMQLDGLPLPEFLQNFELFDYDWQDPEWASGWFRLRTPAAYNAKLVTAMLDVPPPIPMIRNPTIRLRTLTMHVQYWMDTFERIAPEEPVQAVSRLLGFRPGMAGQHNSLYTPEGVLIATCTQTYAVK